MLIRWQNGVMKKSYRDRMGAGISLDYRYKGFQVRNQVSFDLNKSQDSPYGSFSSYASALPSDRYKEENGVNAQK